MIQHHTVTLKKKTGSDASPEKLVAMLPQRMVSRDGRSEDWESSREAVHHNLGLEESPLSRICRHVCPDP